MYTSPFSTSPGYTIARWVGGGWEAVEKADAEGKLFGVYVVKDRWNRPVLLFKNPWKVSDPPVLTGIYIPLLTYSRTDGARSLPPRLVV